MSIEEKKATPQGITGLSRGWQLNGINLSTGHKLFKEKIPLSLNSLQEKL